MNDSKDLFFFDEGCPVGQDLVAFCLKHLPPTKRVFFAPIGGENYKSFMAQTGKKLNPNNLTVITEDSQILENTNAIIYLVKKLPYGISLLGFLASIIPASIRDEIYSSISVNKRSSFGLKGGSLFAQNHREDERLLP